MTNISIGKYVPYNSFLHRLDPRNKLVFVIMIMVAIFMGYSTWSTTFIMGGLLLILIVILMLISHISLIDLFNSLKVLWIMVIFLLIINVLIPKGGYTWVCLNINGYIIYWESILQSAKIILRLVLMISLTLILTSTTKPLELTYALEWFMAPLKVIKFPAHEIAMTISIALRFIPTLLDETDRIMKAQASRGVDFEKGKLTSKVRAIIALIVPLFISAFQRSEELAN